MRLSSERIAEIRNLCFMGKTCAEVIDHIHIEQFGKEGLSPSEIELIKEEYAKAPKRDKLVLEQISDHLAKQAETARMKRVVEHETVMAKYNELEVAKKKADELSKLDFFAVDPIQVERLKAKNADNFQTFNSYQIFIGKMFAGIVPFTNQNLILILGQTGGSKTTSMVNLSWSVVRQQNPATGNHGKVLIISNEESEADILNRMACLCKLEDPNENGARWNYSHRESFDAHQVRFMNEFIDRFKSSGLIKIIDPSFGNQAQFTSYIENVRAILEQAANSPGVHDCIVVDYYQNIRYSQKNPKLTSYQVQDEFASLLNYYKDRVGCPIVLMAQMKPFKKDVDWQDRIVGTKAIAQPCTFIMEVIANRETYTTTWVIRKARYGAMTKINTGFKNGRIVAADAAFKDWASDQIARINVGGAESKLVESELAEQAKVSEINDILKMKPA